jgi:thiamine thiazole synthase
MGPTFGGMLLSGEKVADLIVNQLKVDLIVEDAIGGKVKGSK